MNRKTETESTGARQWRSVAVALAFLVPGAWVVQRVDLVYGGPDLAGGVYPALAVVLAAFAGLAGRWLTRSDRALVYAVLTIGLPIAGSGLLHRFLPALVTGQYGGFASPAGRYYPFVSRIPYWMIPGGPGADSATGAFEGGMAVPWSAWLPPLLFWSIFAVAVFSTSLCLVSCLKRRWVETERLSFPVLALPQGLIDGSGAGRLLLQTRGFWIGAAFPAELFGINGLHHYLPAVGEIRTTLDLGDFLLDAPWRSMAPFTSPFQYELSPMLTGLAYLMPVEVSFSTWFFYLASRAQLLAVDVAGLSDAQGSFPGLGSQWLDWPNTVPFFMCQARGGLLLLALYSLWQARPTLAEAASKRSATFIGLCGGLLVVWGMMWAVGLGPVLAMWALLLYVLFAVAFLRLRADGGLPVTGSPVILGYLFYLAMGTGPDRFDPMVYVGFGFLAVLAYTSMGAWPTIQLEMLKLLGDAGIHARPARRALGTALLVGLVVGVYFWLTTVYDAGLFALDQQGGARAEARLGRYYHYLYADAGTLVAGTDWSRIGFHVVGAGVAMLLAWFRGRFLRWPLHPIGYIYGIGFGWAVWGGAFTGWLAKWLVTRYGGARTYRRVRPFFLGLIFGQLGMQVFWGLFSLIRNEAGAGYGM